MFARLKQLVSPGRFGRSVALLAGGAAFGHALVVLASPVVTRLYDPTDMGVAAVFASILAILVPVATLRYELAIPLPEEDAKAGHVLGLCLVLVVFASISCHFGARFLGEHIVRWTRVPALGPYLPLLAPSLAATGFCVALRYWAIRKKTFSGIAGATLAQRASLVSAQLGLGALQFGILGLVAARVAGPLVGFLVLGALAWKTDRTIFARVRLRNLSGVAARYYRFPLFSSPAGLLNSTATRIAPVLLAAIYDTRIAGWFALVQGIMALPMSLVGRAVGEAFFGNAAILLRDNPRQLKVLFKKLAWRLLALGTGPIVLAGLVAPYVMGWVFGKAWAPAGEYAMLLTPALLLQFVVSPLSPTLNILEYQSVQFLWDMLRVCSVLAVFLVASSLGLEAGVVIGLYSVVLALLYALNLVLCTLAIRARVGAHGR